MVNHLVALQLFRGIVEYKMIVIDSLLVHGVCTCVQAPGAGPLLLHDDKNNIILYSGIQ